MNTKYCKKIDTCPLCNSKLHINTQPFPISPFKLEGDNYDKVCMQCNNFYFGVENDNIIVLRFKIDDFLYFMDDDKYENEVCTFIDNGDDVYINVDFKMLPKSFGIKDLRATINRILDLNIYT